MKQKQVIIRDHKGRVISNNNRRRRVRRAEMVRSIPRKYRKVVRDQSGLIVREHPGRKGLLR